MTEFSFHLASPLDRFIRDHGKEFEAQALPEHYQRGAHRACFRNAYALISSASGRHLNYVEGLALDRKINLSIHHAWAVDEEGKVYDPTWPNPKECAYLGVIIRTPVLLEEVSRNGVYGVLDTGRGFNFDFVRRHFGWAVK